MIKMKSILLINPPLSDNKRYGKGISKISSILPPLGLMYLGAVLEKNDYVTEILDCQLEKFDIHETISYIVMKKKFDYIGLSCNTAQLSIVIELTKHLKNIYPNVPILVGGAHPSIFPKEVLNKNIDFVIIGEGEETIIELLTSIEKKTDLNKVDGIGYISKNNEIIITNKRKLISDLDIIPYPARHLLPIQKYVPAPHQYKQLPSTTMITSRGCPFICKFCSSKNIWTRKYRKRSVDDVIQEIKILIKIYDVKDINFWDDLWGISDKWILEFCEKIHKNNIKISWSCELRVDSVAIEVLEAMKNAGCWAIFYGMESLDQEILDNVNKKIKVKQIEEAIINTKKVGIEVRANFIIGLPGDSPEKIKKMVKRLIELDPDYVKFNIFTPYPGTEFYDEIKQGQWGYMTNNNDKLTNYFATFKSEKFESLKQIENLRTYAHKKFYLRPKFILNKLINIKDIKDVKKYINGFLAIIKS